MLTALLGLSQPKTEEHREIGPLMIMTITGQTVEVRFDPTQPQPIWAEPVAGITIKFCCAKTRNELASVTSGQNGTFTVGFLVPKEGLFVYAISERSGYLRTASFILGVTWERHDEFIIPIIRGGTWRRFVTICDIVQPNKAAILALYHPQGKWPIGPQSLVRGVAVDARSSDSPWAFHIWPQVPRGDRRWIGFLAGTGVVGTDNYRFSQRFAPFACLIFNAEPSYPSPGLHFYHFNFAEIWPSLHPQTFRTVSYAATPAPVVIGVVRSR